jgi:hypothetical protein
VGQRSSSIESIGTSVNWMNLAEISEPAVLKNRLVQCLLILFYFKKPKMTWNWMKLAKIGEPGVLKSRLFQCLLILYYFIFKNKKRGSFNLF